MGMLSLMHDLGVELTSTLRLDASAALGILPRKGVGKIRHLDVGCFWLREKEAREQIRLAKEPGETDPTDIGTKHLAEEVMIRHLHRMSCEFGEGRPEASSEAGCTGCRASSGKAGRRQASGKAGRRQAQRFSVALPVPPLLLHLLSPQPPASHAVRREASNHVACGFGKEKIVG